MISLIIGFSLLLIIGILSLIELAVEVLCIAIGIPIFMVIGIFALFQWFFEKLSNSLIDKEDD